MKETVSKEWASSAREILTSYHATITSLFDRLLTLTSSHVQAYRQQAARDRLEIATKQLVDSVKFGWAHGINGEQTRFTQPAKIPPNRRIGALLPLAIAAGRAIGKIQRDQINRAHRNAEMAGKGVHHNHETHPPA